MRKTNIALLVAVVSSPLAFADSDPYGYDYDPYSGTGGESSGYYEDDAAGTTVTDSFNKDIEKTLEVSYEKDVTIKDSYNEDNDKMVLYDVNNKDIYEYTDNSKYHHSTEFSVDIEENYYMAKSKLEGAVTYSEVTYGAGCCGGYGYDHGYGDPVESSLTVTQTNTMQDAFTSASGINIAGQNAGNNSLVQQSASTNAMITGQ